METPEILHSPEVRDAIARANSHGYRVDIYYWGGGMWNADLRTQDGDLVSFARRFVVLGPRDIAQAVDTMLARHANGGQA